VIKRVVQASVAVVAVIATLVVPIRTAWGAPEVRIVELPVPTTAATIATVPTVATPSPTSHLGVRWIGDDDVDVEVELRWRAGAGAWSDWEHVHVSDDLGDPARRVRLSDLLLVDDATEVQVEVHGPGEVGSLKVVAIDTRHGPRPLRVVGAAAGAATNPDAHIAQPDVISRAEWEADESLRSGTPSHASIEKMSIHHTVTGNNDPDPAATVRAIYAYHTQSNGWNDIGYNFLVDHRGRIYEGRWARTYAKGEEPTGEDKNGDGVVGAHTGGHNTGTVGVALLGTYSTAAPPSAAVRSLEGLLAWEADRHAIDATGTTKWNDGSTKPTIIGHRDAKPTSCPGDELYAQLPQIRRTVADAVAAANATVTNTGYWTLGRDGNVYAFGEATSSTPAIAAPLIAPVVSIAPTPTGDGYWILSSNGRITPHGDAGFYGSTEAMALNAPVARLEPTPTGDGYWVLGRDGGVFSFGDAAFHGSTGAMKLNAPVISMAATPAGGGYWLLAADGGVFTFGDGAFYGSTGAMKLNAPVVSMAPHPSGGGYWLQARDGGIFSFGGVNFYGSVPGLRLEGTADSVQIRATPAGRGYYVLGADGGIFTFGDSRFYGAQPGLAGDTAATDLALHFVPET
jgi:hypothetical protein